jgi:uncharacterized protein (DUF433 family)
MGVGWEDRIAIDPDILGGKPVVEGARLAVELISLDWPDEDFGRDLEAIQATQPKADFPEWPS